MFVFVALVSVHAHPALLPNVGIPVSTNSWFADRLLRGTSAVEYLGNRTSIASSNGLESLTKLKGLFISDQDVAINMDSGRVVYTCQGLDVTRKPPVVGMPIQPQNLLVTTPDPIDARTPRNDQGLPLLSSRPTSVKTILLDFDGCTVTENSWWYNTFTNAYYDPSGDGPTFSDAEQSNIIAIWRAVAEDFAAFDVDVTTIDRGVDRIISNFYGDHQVGIRVCIGGSSYEFVLILPCILKG